MKILCVDDEPLALQRLVNKVQLVKPNALILSFRLANDAINSLNDNKFDVAFLDIEMVNINGLNLAKIIKENNPHCKVCFVTGYSQYAVESYRIHMDGYILKPVREEYIKENLDYFFPNKLEVKCFGNFDIFFQGKQVKFKRSKCKELIAYLIDRKGTSATANECIAVLYEDKFNQSIQKMFATVVSECRKTLKEIGLEEVFTTSFNSYAINPNLIICDYYEYLEKDKEAINKYTGEYMNQYSWAENTNEFLNNYKKVMEI